MPHTPKCSDATDCMTHEEFQDLLAQIERNRQEMRRLDAMMPDVIFWSAFAALAVVVVVGLLQAAFV